MDYLIAGVVLTVLVLIYIRWQKNRDRERWPEMWSREDKERTLVGAAGTAFLLAVMAMAFFLVVTGRICPC